MTREELRQISDSVASMRKFRGSKNPSDMAYYAFDDDYVRIKTIVVNELQRMDDAEWQDIVENGT